MAAVGGKRGMPYVSWAYNYGTVMQNVTNSILVMSAVSFACLLAS